jgi:PleD family two-component response regulator
MTSAGDMQQNSDPDDESDAVQAASDPSEPDGGGAHSAVRVLMTRSKLAQAMKEVPKFKNILIIEDNQRDSDRLASTLRTIFGYDATVRQCRTLGTALDEVLSDQPELVFLDDRLGPVDKAEKSVPFLRSARYGAMILVLSSFIDRRRRAEIMKLGVDDVIDKDDLDSTSICQALIAALARKRSAET